MSAEGRKRTDEVPQVEVRMIPEEEFSWRLLLNGPKVLRRLYAEAQRARDVESAALRLLHTYAQNAEEEGDPHVVGSDLYLATVALLKKEGVR